MLTYIKRKIKSIKSSFRYDYSFLKVLNSPFVGLQLKWYFGEIKHGTPYFLPRKWVKCDFEDAHKAWNKMSLDTQAATIKVYNGVSNYFKYYVKNHTKPIPIKYFGWHFTSLGWKTKWEDYRFEWNPSLSIVIFGKQLFITIIPKMEKASEDKYLKIDSYWEAWLNYEYKTNKSKSKEERVEELYKIYSCTWISSNCGVETRTDYYPLILKKKYIKEC